jgi:predicted Zn-ribbon and HTH transcriptional regulator
MKSWTEAEIDVLMDNYPKHGKEYCAKILGRSTSSVKSKAQKLGIKHTAYSKYVKTQKDHERDIKGLGYSLIDEYIDPTTKIWHKHNKCGFEFKAAPTALITDRAQCPNCASHSLSEPHYLYFIKFEELGLYKVGITKNLNTRLKQFGYSPTLLKSWYFTDGNDARNNEQRLLKGVLCQKLANTGKLRTGNTETFYV